TRPRRTRTFTPAPSPARRADRRVAAVLNDRRGSARTEVSVRGANLWPRCGNAATRRHVHRRRLDRGESPITRTSSVFFRFIFRRQQTLFLSPGISVVFLIAAER